MVTLKKLLSIPGLKDIELVAGKSGLQRRVGHVTVMEVPDIVRWLKGDDFLITSLYAVKDDIGAQCDLLKKLALSACACVAVKTGQYVREISGELMAVADEHSMPLLRIPYALSYIDIIVNIMNYIFEEQNPRVVLEKYIRDVLFEAYTDPGLMIERGNMLGLNADRTRYVAMTLRFADEDDPGGADVQALQREGIALAQFASAQSGLQHCIAVNTQANCSIFLDSDSESTLARLLPFIENAALAQLNEIFRQHRVCIGYGHSDGGLPGIRNTYASSLQALRAGRIFYPDRQVHHYGEMEIYCVMEKVIGNGEIAQLDGILEKIGNRELLDTLVAYFDFDASVEGAAAKLFAHKNTVKYRLHRIKDLTGLDIKSFSDAMKLYMAVVAHKIRRSRGHS